jgi:2-keto-4-pentenoate hydratase
MMAKRWQLPEARSGRLRIRYSRIDVVSCLVMPPRADSEAADRELVERLAAAHRDGARVPYVEALQPADLAAAYAVQARVAAALGAKVAGWKVGIRPDGTPMAAPIYAHLVQESGATWTLPAAGPLVVEVELAFRLDDDLPSRSEPWTRDEIVEAAGEVLVGIELIHWRFEGNEPPPFLAFLADNLGNAGYVIGEATRDIRRLDLARRRCRVSVDADLAHDAIGGHPQDDPWAPLQACLDQGLVGLAGFRAGQFITTGSLIVPLRPARRTVVRAELAGIGNVAVTFEH